MDDTVKEQLILKDYLTKRGVAFDDDKFNDFYSKYQSKKTGAVGDIYNRTKAGAKSALASGQLLVGDIEGATENIKRANELRSEDPELQNRINAIMESESIPDTLLNLVKDPKAAVSLLGESLPTSIAAGATAIGTGGVLTAPIKKPIKKEAARAIGSAVFGGITGAAEYGSTILQTMAENGVDITDPEQIELVITHPEIGPKLKQKGLERGVPIGMFDSVSFGIAGRLLQLGKGGLAAEVAAQAALGGSGEASAQLVSEGEITDPASIGVEIGLEALTGAPQAIVQPALENIVQGSPEASMGLIEGTGTDPEAILSEITAIDPESGPNSPIKDPEEPEKDRKLESKVRTAQKITYPEEVARGTPKQMTNRLLRLPKAELVTRAVENAGIDPVAIEGKTKRDIANQILDRYNIDRTKEETVQSPTEKTPSLTAETKAEAKPIPAELTKINEPSRAELLKIAKRKIKSDKNTPIAEVLRQKEVIEQADNWLSQLPDNQELGNTLTKISRNKNKLNFTGKSVEQANQAIKKIKSPHTKKETKAKATADLVRNLKETGFFAPDEVATLEGKNPELVNHLQKRLDAGIEDGVKEVINQLLSNPRTRDALVGEIFNDFKEDRQVKTDTPSLNRLGKKYAKLINRDVEVPPQRLARDPDVAPEQQQKENQKAAEEISEYEAVKAIKVMKNNAEVPNAIFEKETYDLDRNSYKKSGIGSTYKSMLRSFDFLKTMGAKARSEPIFAPFFQLYRAKDAFREQLFRQHLNDFILLKEQHGIKRLEGASAVLDILAGPHNKNGAQFIETNEAGQVRFTDVDGTKKLVDLSTSQAIQDLQKLFKQQLLIEMQTFKNKAADTYGFGKEAQRDELLDTIEELRALGEDNKAKKLEELVEIFDKMEKLYRSKKAYFPHTRNRGPYAIATYRRTGDDAEKFELAGLYSIKSDKFGNIDRTDESEVRQRIQDDQEKYGEVFVTSKGEAVTGAQPFLMTYEDLRKNIMRDAKNPNIAYEALSNLLTNKNIDPEVLNKVFDEVSFDSETERFFLNYRDKKNYYGYDIDDPISSMLDSLNARSAMLTRFQYQQPMTKLYAQATQDLQKLGKAGRKSLRQLDDYYNYMSTPADDAAKIREITFWYFLAGNPSTSLLQLMSTYMNTLPWLAQYQGPVGFIQSNVKSFTTSLYKAGKIQANKALLTSRTIPEFSKKVGLSETDSKALLSLYERGVLDPGYAIDAVNYSRNQEKQRKILRGQDGLPAGLETVRNVGQGMIQVTEDVARLNTALLVLDSIKKPRKFQQIGKLLHNNDPLFRELVKSKYEGRITKEAVLEHAIDENHAIFGKNPRPSGLRSRAGAGLFAFLQYPISVLEQMVRLLTTRGVAGKKAALNMILVYPILFGGMTAIPGYETWDWMTKWLQRLLGEGGGPTNLDLLLVNGMDELGWNPTMKDAVMKGSILSAGADVDASTRISVQFPLQPFLDVFLSPESNGMTSQSQALQFLGPLATIPTGAMNMLNRIEGGDNAGEAFVDSLAPIWFRNIKKAEDLRKGELRNIRGKKIIEGPESNPELYGGSASDEYIRQLMGLRPSVVSEATRAHYYQSVEQGSDRTGRTKTYSKVAKALAAKRNGEPNASKELAKALHEAWKYNKNSDTPKSRKEFVRALKQSVRGRMESEIQPLKQRRPISKDRRISEDVTRFGLPRIQGQVQNKE
jgi:hypothetical protein